MRSWHTRRPQFDRDVERVADRIRQFYNIRGEHIEPVGFVYYWWPEPN